MRTSVRKVSIYTVSYAWTRFECTIAGIVSRSTQIGSGPQLRVATALEVELAAWNIEDRRPWEACVNIQDSTE